MAASEGMTLAETVVEEVLELASTATAPTVSDEAEKLAVSDVDTKPAVDVVPDLTEHGLEDVSCVTVVGQKWAEGRSWLC